MNRNRIHKAACLVTGFVLCPVLQAQQLTLFEPTQSAQNPGASFPAQEANAPVLGVYPSDPAFTLGAAARFGDAFQTVLRDRAGQSVTLAWQPGQRTPVPGHPGFTVVEASAASVTLELPSQERCMPAPERGVACTGDTLARLSLATLAPLEGPVEEQLPQGLEDTGAMVMGPQPLGAMSDGGEPAFVNPFVGIEDTTTEISEAEVQARFDAMRARAQRRQQFQPQRILEDQVPTGMRLVRTPFGDRLVPIRE